MSRGGERSLPNAMKMTKYMPGPEDTMTVDGLREQLVRLFAALSFIIFFQAFMVAPLIPHLSIEFGVSEQFIGLIVPTYMIPYGLSTLFYGLLSDRLGRRHIIYLSLSAFAVLTLLTATAHSAQQMLVWRFLTGLGASGIVPLALASVGNMFPPERRGRPLGWLFGAMAGGMAFGSSFGVMLRPYIGWRMLFVGVAVTVTPTFFALPRFKSLLDQGSKSRISVAETLEGYRGLLNNARGLRTYGTVLVNSLFHSGVYTWLGVYFVRRYHLGEIGIGFALLGYGVPGFLFGPVIGRWADRWGRRWMIPFGLIIAAFSVAILVLNIPLVEAAVAVALVSLGYDMTQPLLAGIVTQLGSKRPGQAMGLNVFILFTGFGVGSILFGAVAARGFDAALLTFSAVQTTWALAALFLFRREPATNILHSPQQQLR
jgi:predicted MFS family arabinose efflux permease